MELRFRDEKLVLLPERALYLPQYRMLVVADVHIGKSAHFRKEGLIMPAVSSAADLDLVGALCYRYEVSDVLFLGDLFHSRFNSEWFLFENFLHKHPDLHIILAKGNHDILPEFLLEESNVVLADSFVAGDLLFTHHPLEAPVPGTLNIAGHIHPGCLLRNKGFQSYRLPCFYFCDNVLLLPAFGSLTGMHMVRKTEGARIFPVFKDEVLEQP